MLIIQKLVASIFFPFISFIFAIANKLRFTGDKLVVILFSGYVGLNMAIENDGPDINRIREDFLAYSSKDYTEYFDFLMGYLYLKDGHYDIFLETIYFFLSRVSESPLVLYLFLGITFGWIYSNVLAKINQNNNDLDLFSWSMFILIIVLIFPTQGINQFRFWTASLIFSYGIFESISKNQLKYLLIVFISPLVHIALGLPVVIYILFLVTKKLGAWPYVIILLLILFSSASLTYVLDPIFNDIGGALGDKYSDYTGEMASQRLESFRTRIWYASYWREIGIISLAIITTLNYLKYRFVYSVEQVIFYRLLLLFLAFTVLISNFFMHFRYYELILFLQLIHLYTAYNEISLQGMDIKGTKKLLLLFSPALFLVFGLQIASILQMQKIMLPIGNFITAWFIEDNTSIWTYLGF